MIGVKPDAYRRASFVPTENLACAPARLCQTMLSRSSADAGRRTTGSSMELWRAVERAHRVRNVLAHARERAAMGGRQRVEALLGDGLAHARASGLGLAVAGAPHEPRRIERC